MHAQVPSCGRRPEPARTARAGKVLERFLKRLEAAFTVWLDRNIGTDGPPVADPQHVLASIRAGDVVLVAGRTRMSRFIRFLSGCPWTHVALCVGRLEEYSRNADPTLCNLIARAAHGDPKEPVLIEALLGRGTILTPLKHYRTHAVKICRPHKLSPQRVGRLIQFAVRHLGFEYDLRQILDLVRLAVPLPSFARRWRSTLFDPEYAASRRCICSTLLVRSFTSVAYPVVAVAAPPGDAAYKASLEANPRLATPRDFDASPYFESLEFPLDIPAAAPPVPQLPGSRAKVRQTGGAAGPYAPAPFPGQVLKPCYASVPLRPAQRLSRNSEQR